MNSWDALRRNLTALIDAANDGLISGPTGVLQLESVTDIGKSTLYRILDAREQNPTQLDTLEKIAAAYNLQVWQLLVPRLDPLDPPESVGSRRMKVLREVFQQTQKDAALEQQQHLAEGSGTVDTTPATAGAGAHDPRARASTGRTAAGNAHSGGPGKPRRRRARRAHAHK